MTNQKLVKKVKLQNKRQNLPVVKNRFLDQISTKRPAKANRTPVRTFKIYSTNLKSLEAVLGEDLVA